MTTKIEIHDIVLGNRKIPVELIQGIEKNLTDYPKGAKTMIVVTRVTSAGNDGETYCHTEETVDEIKAKVEKGTKKIPA